MDEVIGALLDQQPVGERCTGCDCDLYLVEAEDHISLLIECDCSTSVVAA